MTRASASSIAESSPARVSPSTPLPSLADREVERGRGEAAVGGQRLEHVVLGDAEVVGDLADAWGSGPACG